MTGRIRKLGGRRNTQNTETKIVGGSNLPASKERETKIVDQRVKQRPTEISDSKGDKIVVKTHTRTRPKGN